MNNLILSKTKNLTIKLIKNWNFLKSINSTKFIEYLGLPPTEKVWKNIWIFGLKVGWFFFFCEKAILGCFLMLFLLKKLSINRLAKK